MTRQVIPQRDRVVATCRNSFEADPVGQSPALLTPADFRATVAFPAIVDSLPAIGAWKQELLGDVLAEALLVVRVSPFDGNLERLTSLIENDRCRGS